MLRSFIQLLCLVLMLLSLSVLFLSVYGCMSFYEAVGLSPAQVTTQSAKDANSIITVVEQGRETFEGLATAGIAALATIVSGYLGILLRKEKAISRTVITGIELSGSGAAKEAVFLASTAAGTKKIVADRVSDLTDRKAMPNLAKPTEKVD